MKMDTKTMFSTLSPWRLFFRVALPGMVSMFAMSIYSIFEGIFIGQRLGEVAFAAVNIAMPVVLINFSIADLVGVGSSVPISIALGKKDERTANNYFSCSIILIVLAAIIMGLAMFFAAEPVSFKATSVPSSDSLTTCSAASPELFIAFRFLLFPGFFFFLDKVQLLQHHAGAHGNVVT